MRDVLVKLAIGGAALVLLVGLPWLWRKAVQQDKQLSEREQLRRLQRIKARGGF